MQTSRYHSPNWKESPAIKNAGLPMFFLVDIFVWYDVQQFLRSILRTSVMKKSMSISVKDIPRDSILLLDEQMEYRYKAPRRDSFFAVKPSCNPTTL